MKQTLRLIPGILLLGIAVSTAVSSVQWMTNQATLQGPAGLSWEATPSTCHVSFPLESEDVIAVYGSKWKQEHLVVALGGGRDVLVRLDRQAYQDLLRDGDLQVQGMVTQGLPHDVQPAPGHAAPGLAAERYLMVLHTGKSYPVNDGWYGFGICAVALVLSFLALRAFVRNRRPTQAGDPRLGLFERLASRYPGLFEALGRYRLNGFGLEFMDFHAARPDGSFLATSWLTVGFMPIAPVRRLRIRALSKRVRLWVPFVVTATATNWETLESLPVDRSRSLRVYLFYYLVFLPLAVGPLLGLGLWFVLARPDWSAGVIWGLLGACLVWGVGMVWMQDRVMKRHPCLGFDANQIEKLS